MHIYIYTHIHTHTHRTLLFSHYDIFINFPTSAEKKSSCVADGQFKLSGSCPINLKINTKISSTTHNKK